VMSARSRIDHPLLCIVAFAPIGLAVACDPASPPGLSTPTTTAPAPVNAALPPEATAPRAPPPAPVHTGQSNPLSLPPRRIKIDPGRRVFTFSEPMLQNARLGSTLVLYAANVAGFEGDDLLIEGKSSPSYKVHAGYVIPVPDTPRVHIGDPVLSEWNGVMKHAVVARFVKDRVALRYTDMGSETQEGLVKNPRLVKQVEGLAPGNYAAFKQEQEWRHVLLVSPIEGEPKRWFALAFGGAASIVDEPRLRPIPIRWNPRPGTEVWAEWVGTMRRGIVQSAGETGLFTVKYERAGRPVTVGWGLLMQPIAEDRPGSR
jgi:hypothetical protein